MSNMSDPSGNDDADAAMAAMGLPSNFAAPAFPQGGRGRGGGNSSSGRGVRPPPTGPSNRGGGRGRDIGWGGRGRGRGGPPHPGGYQAAPFNPSRPAYSNRGGHQAHKGGNARRGGDRPIEEGPLVPLEDIQPLFRPSFIEEDPWSHLS